MKGCIFVSFRYFDTDNVTNSWLKMYLQTRYRSKLGWFFWFGPIHVTIRRNLGTNLQISDLTKLCVVVRAEKYRFAI